MTSSRDDHINEGCFVLCCVGILAFVAHLFGALR